MNPSTFDLAVAVEEALAPPVHALRDNHETWCGLEQLRTESEYLSAVWGTVTCRECKNAAHRSGEWSLDMQSEVGMLTGEDGDVWG